MRKLQIVNCLSPLAQPTTVDVTGIGVGWKIKPSVKKTYKPMSWAIKIVGKRPAVAAALRDYGLRKGIYPDAQRDSVLENAAAMIEAMTTSTLYENGVIVEGSGHQGSNYQIKVDNTEIAESLPEKYSPQIA